MSPWTIEYHKSKIVSRVFSCLGFLREVSIDLVCMHYKNIYVLIDKEMTKVY